MAGTFCESQIAKINGNTSVSVFPLMCEKQENRATLPSLSGVGFWRGL